MSWFFITLLGPLLYACTNHIDKFLLKRYFTEGGVGTLLLFSSLLSALALPFFYLADPSIFSLQPNHILALMSVGVLNVLVLLFYFLALKDEEVSVAIVFYQLVPVFGYVLGFFILKETLTTIQLIAMSIIILGTTVVAIEIDHDNKFTLRHKTIGLMVAASFFWALGSVIFKAVALEENVWRTLFWEHVMLAAIGLVIFILVKSYRNHFLTVLKTNSKAVISLNFANESLYMVGNLVFAFSYLLAPVALVLLINSFQAIFVFLIGILLTVFFPAISVENIHIKLLIQKTVAICITAVGTYLLLINS